MMIHNVKYEFDASMQLLARCIALSRRRAPMIYVSQDGTIPITARPITSIDAIAKPVIHVMICPGFY